MRRSVAVVAPLAATGCGLAGLRVHENARSERAASAALGRVQVGMPWPEAEWELARGAWRRTRCDIEHVFWYGSRDPDRAGRVYVQIDPSPRGWVVTLVGTLEHMPALGACQEVPL